MPEKTALDELLKLRNAQAEREEKLFLAAKSELGERYYQLKQDYETLGISMPGAGRTLAAGGGRGGTKRPLADRNCPVCSFKTHPLHDSRSHKSQNPKKPWTAAELKERGLEKA